MIVSQQRLTVIVVLKLADAFAVSVNSDAQHCFPAGVHKGVNNQAASFSFDIIFFLALTLIRFNEQE